MRIVFWGTPEFSVPTLNTLVSNGHDIVGVVTQPDRRRGRGKSLQYSAVKKRALELNLPIFTPVSIRKDIDIQKKLKNIPTDLYIVVAFGQLLPKEILEIPTMGSWNSHASLLPKYRGAAPIQWSLINNEKSTGVCIMHMEEGLDTGPVIHKKQIDIDILDNANTLEFKLSKLSALLIKEALSRIQMVGNGDIDFRLTSLKAQKQDNTLENITYARMIHNEDRIISWDNPSITVHKFIMGHYPYAKSSIAGKTIKILDTIPISYIMKTNSNLLDLEKYYKFENRPGKILGYEKYGVVCGTLTEPILIKKARFDGKSTSIDTSLSQQIKSLDSKHFV